jgi:predicted dehydrogenase
MKPGMTSKPRLGFLGVGWIGRHRMEMIRNSESAEIAAICDSTPEMLKAAQETAPEAAVIESYEEMLEPALGLDGIVIATPSALHAKQSIAALERGHAVFCQKPLGRSAYEVRQVVEAARHADRLLGVDFSYRLTEGIQKIREQIRAGTIGEVYAMDLVFHNAYGPDKPWFYDRGLSGGGCVMDLGVHLVDLALWILDFPQVVSLTSRLYAGGKLLSLKPKEVEDYAVATLDLSNGVTAQIACSWKLPAGCEAVIGATFYGKRGGLMLRNINGSFYDFTAEHLQGTSRQTLSQPPDAWGGRAAVEWARKLASGIGFETESENLVQVSRVLDSIYGVDSLERTISPIRT